MLAGCTRSMNAARTAEKPVLSVLQLNNRPRLKPAGDPGGQEHGGRLDAEAEADAVVRGAWAPMAHLRLAIGRDKLRLVT